MMAILRLLESPCHLGKQLVMHRESRTMQMSTSYTELSVLGNEGLCWRSYQLHGLLQQAWHGAESEWAVAEGGHKDLKQASHHL
jgi:hypothetical protein